MRDDSRGLIIFAIAIIGLMALGTSKGQPAPSTEPVTNLPVAPNELSPTGSIAVLDIQFR